MATFRSGLKILSEVSKKEGLAHSQRIQGTHTENKRSWKSEDQWAVRDPGSTCGEKPPPQPSGLRSMLKKDEQPECDIRHNNCPPPQTEDCWYHALFKIKPPDPNKPPLASCQRDAERRRAAGAVCDGPPCWPLDWPQQPCAEPAVLQPAGVPPFLPPKEVDLLGECGCRGVTTQRMEFARRPRDERCPYEEFRHKRTWKPSKFVCPIKKDLQLAHRGGGSTKGRLPYAEFKEVPLPAALYTRFKSVDLSDGCATFTMAQPKCSPSEAGPKPAQRKTEEEPEGVLKGRRLKNAEKFPPLRPKPTKLVERPYWNNPCSQQPRCNLSNLVAKEEDPCTPCVGSKPSAGKVVTRPHIIPPRIFTATLTIEPPLYEARTPSDKPPAWMQRISKAGSETPLVPCLNNYPSEPDWCGETDGLKFYDGSDGQITPRPGPNPCLQPLPRPNAVPQPTPECKLTTQRYVMMPDQYNIKKSRFPPKQTEDDTSFEQYMDAQAQHLRSCSSILMKEKILYDPQQGCYSPPTDCAKPPPKDPCPPKRFYSTWGRRRLHQTHSSQLQALRMASDEKLPPRSASERVLSPKQDSGVRRRPVSPHRRVVACDKLPLGTPMPITTVKNNKHTDSYSYRFKRDQGATTARSLGTVKMFSSKCNKGKKEEDCTLELIIPPEKFVECPPPPPPPVHPCEILEDTVPCTDLCEEKLKREKDPCPKKKCGNGFGIEAVLARQATTLAGEAGAHLLRPPVACHRQESHRGTKSQPPPFDYDEHPCPPCEDAQEREIAAAYPYLQPSRTMVTVPTFTIQPPTVPLRIDVTDSDRCYEKMVACDQAVNFKTITTPCLPEIPPRPKLCGEPDNTPVRRPKIDYPPRVCGECERHPASCEDAEKCPNQPVARGKKSCEECPPKFMDCLKGWLYGGKRETSEKAKRSFCTFTRSETLHLVGTRGMAKDKGNNGCGGGMKMVDTEKPCNGSGSVPENDKPTPCVGNDECDPDKYQIPDKDIPQGRPPLPYKKILSSLKSKKGPQDRCTKPCVKSMYVEPTTCPTKPCPCPKTPCNIDPCNPRCARVCMPCCKPSRCPVACSPMVIRISCRRKPPPKPSFSECDFEIPKLKCTESTQQDKNKQIEIDRRPPVVPFMESYMPAPCRCKDKKNTCIELPPCPLKKDCDDTCTGGKGVLLVSPTSLRREVNSPLSALPKIPGKFLTLSDWIRNERQRSNAWLSINECESMSTSAVDLPVVGKWNVVNVKRSRAKFSKSKTDESKKDDKNCCRRKVSIERPPTCLSREMQICGSKVIAKQSIHRMRERLQVKQDLTRLTCSKSNFPKGDDKKELWTSFFSKTGVKNNAHTQRKTHLGLHTSPPCNEKKQKQGECDRTLDETRNREKSNTVADKKVQNKDGEQYSNVGKTKPGPNCPKK